MEDVAKTILEQLWWNQFIAMTWAKNLMAKKEWLQFKIPKANWINSIVVDYNYSWDDYKITFYNIRWVEFEELKSLEWVYCNQLKSLISKETGLALDL